MSSLRHEDNVTFKSYLVHDPPDTINFQQYRFNGEDRQVFNYRNFLSEEFKIQGIQRLFLFETYPPKRRPHSAYDKLEDGTDEKSDRNDIKDYEESMQKENKLINKGFSLIQMSTTHTVHTEYQRELKRLEKKRNPTLTEREVFVDSTHFFIDQYSNQHRITKFTTLIAHEIQQITPATKMHHVKDLIEKIYSKKEEHERMAYWTKDKYLRLSDSSRS